MENKILGINKRCYPSSLSLFGYVEITCVLVAGEIGDYTVYIGEGLPEYVASHGNKISFKEAICHFPQLIKASYRD